MSKEQRVTVAAVVCGAVLVALWLAQRGAP